MNWMRDEADGQREKVWSLKELMPTQRLVLLALAEGWATPEAVAEACSLWPRQAEIILGMLAEAKHAKQRDDGSWELA